MSLEEFDYYWNISIMRDNEIIKRFILSNEDTKRFIGSRSVLSLIRSRVLANWLISKIEKGLLLTPEALDRWKELTLADAMKLKTSDETNCYGLIREDFQKLITRERGGL